MDARELLYEKFITPLKLKQAEPKRVGMELEFPLINLTNTSAKTMMEDLFAKLLLKGYHPLWQGDILRGVRKEDKYDVTLDTSYSIIEFALAPRKTLIEEYKLWQECFYEIRESLSGRALILDTGLHPQFPHFQLELVPDVEYECERRFLSECHNPSFHGFVDIFAFISSFQTRLEFSLAELPLAFNVFRALDFVEIYLFANSTLRIDQEFYRSGRHYLYSRSRFQDRGLYGSAMKPYGSIDDILDDYAERFLYMRYRDGVCRYLEPVSLREYYQDEKYGAEISDLDKFFTYRNLELKNNGTLERRINCTQPFNELFSGIAFDVGIAEYLEEALELVEQFLKDNDINIPYGILVEKAAKGKLIIEAVKLENFLQDIWRLAIKGLQKRGYEEERFLNCFADKFKRLVEWSENIGEV